MSPARRLRAPGPPLRPHPQAPGFLLLVQAGPRPGERRRPSAGETGKRRCQASSAQLQLGARSFPLALRCRCRSEGLEGGRWGPAGPGVPRPDCLGTAPGPHPDGGHQPSAQNSALATRTRFVVPPWTDPPR